MNWRTPSSLKWLITKHSRLQGELLRLKEDEARLQEKIVEKRATLDGLERVLALHELKIAPDDIAAVLPQRNKWLMKPGEMTDRIYRTLKEHGDWMRTGELISAVTGFDRATDGVVFDHVRKRVRTRLSSLALKGKLERKAGGPHTQHDQTDTQTWWRLASLD